MSGDPLRECELSNIGDMKGGGKYVVVIEGYN